MNNISTESLLDECIRRNLISANQAKRILNKPNQEANKIILQQKADLWITLNPELFAFMERAALKMVSENRKFGTRLISEEARWLCSESSGYTEKFKLANILVTYILKRLVEKHPEVKNYMRMKK